MHDEVTGCRLTTDLGVKASRGERTGGQPDFSVDWNLLAQQIAFLDGITLAEAHDLIESVMGAI